MCTNCRRRWTVSKRITRIWNYCIVLAKVDASIQFIAQCFASAKWISTRESTNAILREIMLHLILKSISLGVGTGICLYPFATGLSPGLPATPRYARLFSKFYRKLELKSRPGCKNAFSRRNMFRGWKYLFLLIYWGGVKTPYDGELLTLCSQPM